MKLMRSALYFTLGAAAGAGAYIGLESLKQNKWEVKKTLNNAIDNVTSCMNTTSK